MRSRHSPRATGLGTIHAQLAQSLRSGHSATFLAKIQRVNTSLFQSLETTRAARQRPALPQSIPFPGHVLRRSSLINVQVVQPFLALSHKLCLTSPTWCYDKADMLTPFAIEKLRGESIVLLSNRHKYQILKIDASR